MSRIAVNQFAILTQECPDEGMALSVELSFQYSVETRQISCEAGFCFNKDSATLLILKSQCEFRIHPEDWEKFHKDGGIEIPRDVLELLAVHTIGASRGILHCKTEDTSFNRLMIPPINVAEMIN